VTFGSLSGTADKAERFLGPGVCHHLGVFAVGNGRHIDDLDKGLEMRRIRQETAEDIRGLSEELLVKGGLGIIRIQRQVDDS